MCSEDHLHFDYVRLAWDFGFCFEEFDGRNSFDVSVIGLVDVDKVAKDRDIATVEKHIPTLLHFKLEQDLSRVLEPNFLKIFKLSQFAIQYLRFCKIYLDNTVVMLKRDILSLQHVNEDLEQAIEELKIRYETLMRKYQSLQESLPSSSFKCDDCRKSFYSEEYLLAHIRRRHLPNSQLQMESEADKLQMEIKELKQRLNESQFVKKSESSDKNEREVDDDDEKEKADPDNDAVLVESVQFKFEQLKAQIEQELSSLKNENFYREICTKIIKDLGVSQKEGGSGKGENSEEMSYIEHKDSNVEQKTSTVELKNSKIEQKNSKTDEKCQEPEERSQGQIQAVGKGNEYNKIDAEISVSKIETSTQTDSKTSEIMIKLVSESTSPLQSPQKNIPGISNDQTNKEDDFKIAKDLKSKETDLKSTEIDLKTNLKSNKTEVKSNETEPKNNLTDINLDAIEEKLSRQVDFQKMSLEKILDAKLSGSLQKMEAQMESFWSKLNAWELQRTRSLPEKINITNSQIDVEDLQVKKPASLIPKPLPRQTKISKKTEETFKDSFLEREGQTFEQGAKNFIREDKNLVKVEKRGAKESEILTKDSQNSERETNNLEKETKNGKTLKSMNQTKATKSASVNNFQNALNSSSDDTFEVVDPKVYLNPNSSFNKRLDEKLSQKLKAQNLATKSHQPFRTVPNSKVEIKDQTSILNFTSTSDEDTSHGTFILSQKNSAKSTNKNKEIKPKSNLSKSKNNKKKSTNLSLKTRLRQYLQDSIGQRLRSVGVSPHWKTLPEKSYNKAMETIEHQLRNSQKNFGEFCRLRRELSKQADHEVMKQVKSKQKRSLKKMQENCIPTPPTSAVSSHKTNHFVENKRPLSPAIKVAPPKDEGIISSASSRSEEENEFKIIHVTEKSAAKETAEPMVETLMTAPGKKRVIFDLENSKETKNPSEINTNNLSKTKQSLSENQFTSSQKETLRNMEKLITVQSDSSDWDISELL